MVTSVTTFVDTIVTNIGTITTDMIFFSENLVFNAADIYLEWETLKAALLSEDWP